MEGALQRPMRLSLHSPFSEKDDEEPSVNNPTSLVTNLSSGIWSSRLVSTTNQNTADEAASRSGGADAIQCYLLKDSDVKAETIVGW